jgi:hypothetical protein
VVAGRVEDEPLRQPPEERAHLGVVAHAATAGPRPPGRPAAAT